MKKLPSWAQEALTPLIVMVALVAVWEASVHLFAIPGYLFPAPSAIWEALQANAANVAGHTLATGRTITFGFIASIVVSLPLAVAITSSRTMANAIYPFLVLTQSIPKVALAPILVVLMGANEMPRVVITFLVAFFPLVLAIAAGLQSVPVELIELGRACRANRWKELVRIRLPYAVPFIFSGLKAAITLSVVGAVVAEFVNADRGLGYLIVTSTAFFQVSLAWAALIVLSVLGIALFQIVALVERLAFPWASDAAR
ncbi:ABC transporter permease [Aureimonas mangrovi]|uniref:ABC transporter permease n=1 Tax=Aureimonas mangrovi TaxID=2758041 RepID=UPI001AED22BB|nr:ABC transporter permease [Aureimonas mangrovi]